MSRTVNKVTARGVRSTRMHPVIGLKSPAKRAGHGRPKHLVRSVVKDPALIEQRQHQLVQAAISVFLDKGFHKASVRDIGRAAGLTQGTIYNYIRSKSDILYLACDEMFGAYQTAIHQATAGFADPLERLREAVRATIAVMQVRQEYILLVYRLSHELDRKSLRAILSRIGSHIDFFEQLVADAAHARSLKVPSNRLAANILTFLPTMLAFRRWDLQRTAMSPDMIANLLVEFMVRGLSSDLVATTSSPAIPQATTKRRTKASTKEEQHETTPGITNIGIGRTRGRNTAAKRA